MRKRLVVYGLLAICAAWVFTAKTQRIQREETEIVIVANPINPLNPVVRNPYQTEYEQMLYPCVRITAGFSTGSGVLFETTDKHRWTQISIISAAHVVSDLNTVNIELYNSIIITGTIVITDTDKDMALIQSKINTDFTGKIYKAKLASKDYQYFLFTPVWAVGCSLGLEPRPSYGHITAITTPFYSPLTKGDLGKQIPPYERGLGGCYGISAPILPGNSGGPVYACPEPRFGNARTYQVIGIAVWVKVYDGQLVTTMAGVVPINQIYEFLEPRINTNELEETTK